MKKKQAAPKKQEAPKTTKPQEHKAPESNDALRKLLEDFKIDGMDHLLFADQGSEADKLHDLITLALEESNMAIAVLRIADELDEQPLTAFDISGLQRALRRTNNALQAGHQFYISSR